MIAWYFAAWIACTMAALGALSLLAIAETSAASWMAPMRRPAEALAGILPLCAIGFAPVAISANHLFPWAKDLSSLSHEVARAVEHKRTYLSLRPFVLRSAFYLLSWTAIAELHRRWSLAMDRSADPGEIARLLERRRVLMAVTLPFILFTGTFAAFDWLMSLEPTWYSHVYGVLFIAAGGAAATAITAISAARMSGHPQMRPEREARLLRPAHLHAIGNMLLAAVMFWAYVGFGQLLIQWIGDIPHEITWYLRRIHGGWTAIAAATGLLHFAIPFLLLLVRGLKRLPRTLGAIAGLVVIGHLLDCTLLVIPAIEPAPSIAAAPFALVPLAIAALFGFYRFRRVAPVPTHDPMLPEALRFEMPS